MYGSGPCLSACVPCLYYYDYLQPAELSGLSVLTRCVLYVFATVYGVLTQVKLSTYLIHWSLIQNGRDTCCWMTRVRATLPSPRPFG